MSGKKTPWVTSGFPWVTNGEFYPFSFKLLIFSRVASPQWTTVNEKERTLRSKTQKKKIWNVQPSKTKMKPPPTLREIQSCPTDIGPTILFGSELYYIYRKNVQNILYVNLMKKSNSHFLMVWARFWDKNQFRSRRTELGWTWLEQMTTKF